MTTEISRETYVNATEEDRTGMTYDILTAIRKESAELVRLYQAHLGVCDKRFKKIEDNEKKLAVVGAFIGGAIVTAFDWAKGLVSKLL